MKTLAAALLVGLSGKKITEDAIKTIFNSVGVQNNDDNINKIVEALEDKNIEEILNEGLKKFSPLSAIGTSSIEEYFEDMEMKEVNNVQVEIDTNANEIYTKIKIIQKFINKEKFPLELKIYMYKSKKIIFSNFKAKIGDSIKVKSKIIKKEKAEKKYTDSISSGNAAIFVCEDPLNDDRIIINMGNIPSKSEVTFISEYIRFTDFSNKYEIELLRNIPIFTGKDNYIFQNSIINGKILICCKNEIINITKVINSHFLKILEEKYLNKEKNEYFLKYKIENLESNLILDYIPSSKIYFDINLKGENLAYMQESSLIENEINYIVQFKNIIKIKQEDNFSSFPSLFIFLVDQSGSMYGESINIASKALKLFLQSLPVGSFYQIIGFGSEYKKYDKIPKEYTKNNIKESLKIIDNLKADLGGTDIYDPLKDIYDSFEIYDNIKLPKNIFLLTDGYIKNKQETLELIERNNSNFSIYSIGIGVSFDKDLIENAGIIGKGNYNFCPNLDQLNKIIVSEIDKVTKPYISQLNIISSLDKNNILQKSAKNCLKENEIIKLNSICKNKEINTNKITVEICYYIKDKKFENSYEIIPYEFPKGEELSKLIIYDNILKNPIKNTENLNNALKYQILYENTSLYANLELSDKIQEQLKLKLIGSKENNTIKIFKKKEEGKRKEERKEIREEEEDDIAFLDIFGGGGCDCIEEEEDIGFGGLFDGGRGGLEKNSENIEDKKLKKMK